MTRISLLFLFISLPALLLAQTPIYEFRNLDIGNYIPSDLNSTRTAVFIQVQPKNGTYWVEGDWKSFTAEVHSYLYRMGIDVVIYINSNDFLSGNSTTNFYQRILSGRSIKNLIFIDKQNDGIEILCSPYNGKVSLIDNNQKAYKDSAPYLNRVMINFGREIKRTENPMQNFLIPDKPTYLDALSIVQNDNLKNYPGQIRRNKMAVEKFSKIPLGENASPELVAKINSFNAQIDSKNQQLEQLLKDFPYQIEFVDYMSDEDLLRGRYQFVLRNLYASGQSIKSMLKYQSSSSEAGYVSVVPIMPDNTSIKTFPKNALLHKFYIRQNIAKNVYVGEWDADETWQKALTNFVGNMMQYFNKGN